MAEKAIWDNQLLAFNNHCTAQFLLKRREVPYFPTSCTFSFTNLQFSLDHLRTLPSPSSAMNKTTLKVVGRILGPRTSRVESCEGTGLWEAIMENQSVGFTIRPYLGQVMVLLALYTILPVTVP